MTPLVNVSHSKISIKRFINKNKIHDTNPRFWLAGGHDVLLPDPPETRDAQAAT